MPKKKPKIAKSVTTAKSVEEWSGFLADVFRELFRVTKTGGWVAFEVGEVRSGRDRIALFHKE